MAERAVQAGFTIISIALSVIGFEQFAVGVALLGVVFEQEPDDPGRYGSAHQEAHRNGDDHDDGNDDWTKHEVSLPGPSS